MNLFKRNKPVPDLHKKLSRQERLEEFYLTNQGLIGLIIIVICIGILVYLIGYAFATGHLHGLSTEANNYEHLNQIVLCTKGVIIKC